ncbi:MAG: hypothetical protein NVSMB16_09100 [Acidimicrobiales bacterium]
MSALTSCLLRNTLRRKWRSYLGVVLLIAFTGGVSLFAIAGARRTQSAYPRYLRSVGASAMSVTGSSGYDETAAKAMPEVVRSRTTVGLQVLALAGDKPDFTQKFEASGTFDGRYFDQDRFVAVRGRTPDPRRVDEIAVNQLSATRLGYHVGQHLELGTYSIDQFSAPSFSDAPPPPKLRTAVTIVGIGVFPDEILQDEGDRTERVLLTPAFTAAARPFVTYALQGLTLRHGRHDVDAVKRRLGGLYPPGTLEVRTTAVDEFHALHATRPLAFALAIFGVLSALAALVLASQALANLIRADRELRAALRAVGAPPVAIARAALAGPSLAIVCGIAVAGLLAVAASPLMPIGPVRRVGGSRIDVDTAVLGLGAVALAVSLLAVVAGVVWRELAGPRTRPARSSRIVATAASAGMAPSAVTGLGMALESSDSRTTASSRSVIVGAVVAVAALIGAVTFGSSLDTLVHRPRLYGWKWDAAVLSGNGYDKMPLEKVHAVLDADRQVGAWSGAYFGFDTIDKQDTPLLGMTLGSAVAPPIIKGRNLQGPSEIVLGAASAQLLHRSLGDTVTMAGESVPHTLTVVGIATFPTIGIIHAAHTSLGIGALVVPELVPGYDRDILGVKGEGLGPSVIFIRYREGTNALRELRHLRDTTQPLAGFAGIDVLDTHRPAEIASSRSIGGAPILLAVALAAASTMSLSLSLGASVRRRRRDLAVLKAIGFTRRQIAATVSWQATTIVVLGLVIGVPVGAAVGRVLWRRFADQLFVVALPTLPLIAIAAVVVVAAVLANAVSVLPARLASRVDPSTVLRPE